MDAWANDPIVSLRDPDGLQMVVPTRQEQPPWLVSSFQVHVASLSNNLFFQSSFCINL